ncbi:30S ribosomal protein S5 [Candidatus Aerophobetes bacterium]|nr:30S ribosomal protein S5 [Candidatus Aerophobetes bacterium]
MEERVIRVRRVFTVVKGGRRIGFNALVVIGDRKGRVGLSLGKAKELLGAIEKARRKAEKNLITIPIKDGTIPHQVQAKFGASCVLLKPASPGTGVVAGPTVRAVVELAGIENVLTKSLGSNNPLNTAKATLIALKMLRSPEEILELRRRKE